jgi:23S rRNA (adenine2030-N6)-methyltransferase
MLAYRHAFHAGNHADVLKHLVLMLVLQHLNEKAKGWRLVDTHAGAGGYALSRGAATKNAEFEDGIARLVGRDDLPPPLADYVALVRGFNGPGTKLKRYPGSPAIARALMRPQDELRLFELHPTDHRLLAAAMRGAHGVQVAYGDGYEALRATLPPPTRRGAVLIDPPYELKTDYARAHAALREALTRFADGAVIVWYPQIQHLESARIARRLQTAAAAQAPKGWLHARLSVARPDARGFGLVGSGVVVANPPHTLRAQLQAALPWLTAVLGRHAQAGFVLETGAGTRA